ncbi:uncharacterized protein LOC121813081 isoform X1 [Haplochromis burtoni]|uniref:uncharacterized protein LOC121813081 isoform X1 n=1 Tax=Haplochromis burtoni TaxID=8153 RepID=UPI001C2DE1E3|nr:uncharacterized protein LOC121813081 isoform X1 [Haplochromis burtoni]
MTLRKLCFVLLLPILVCYSDEAGTEILMKIIDKQPDVTRICSNETLNVIMLIVCKISTQRSRGEECRLLYKHGHNFEHGCDSRFTLMKENGTVFLHLKNVTAEDGGSYTCECVQTGGTYKLQLSVTVEVPISEEEENINSTDTSISLYLITAAGVVIVTGVNLAFFYWLRSRGCRSRSETIEISVRKTSSSVYDNDLGDQYRSLRQPGNDLYQNIASVRYQRNIRTHAARRAENVCKDNLEMDQVSNDYENI